VLRLFVIEIDLVFQEQCFLVLALIFQFQEGIREEGVDSLLFGKLRFERLSGFHFPDTFEIVQFLFVLLFGRRIPLLSSHLAPLEPLDQPPHPLHLLPILLLLHFQLLQLAELVTFLQLFVFLLKRVDLALFGLELFFQVVGEGDLLEKRQLRRGGE
jgi:hypothetical protein